MNSLMKQFKKIIIAIILIVIFVISMIIIFIPETITDLFLTVEYEYVQTSSLEYIELEIPIYSKVKDSIYLDKTLIKNSYFTDFSQTEIINVEINDINYLEETTYNEKIYYEYDLSLVINFIFSIPYYLKEAYLNLCYDNDQQLNLYIGSLCLYNGDNNSLIYCTGLKGNTKIVDALEILDNVEINLFLADYINILNIETLSNFAFTSNYNFVSLDNQNYLLSISLDIDAGKIVQNIGFLITYEQNDVIYKKLIYAFRYYQSNSNFKVVENKV